MHFVLFTHRAEHLAGVVYMRTFIFLDLSCVSFSSFLAVDAFKLHFAGT